MRWFAAVAVCALLAAGPVSAADSKGFQWHANPEDFQAWMASFGNALSGEESLVEFRQKFVQQMLDFGAQFLADESHVGVLARAMSKHFNGNPNPSLTEFREVVSKLLTSRKAEDVVVGGVPTLADDPYSYFGWIPPFVGAAIPNGPAVTYATDCWALNKISSVSNANGSVTFTMSVSGQKELFCSDNYLFATVATLQLAVEIATEGDHIWLWDPASPTPAESWDLTTKGIRVFEFTNGTIETVLQLIDTVLLFVPELINPVDAASAARNVYFMSAYAQVNMTQRTTQVVSIDESTVNSGDFFGIIRLDGLDPMLAWAMGSSTGHTAVAIRDPKDGQLYIAESTVKDVYWPTDGIQRTPFALWVQQAINASYQVVHAPLNPTAAAQFNATDALHFFSTVEGLSYGYYNMLWGWIDTVKDNYPCTPPDFSSKCLQWQHVEVLFPIVNKIVPSIGNLMWTQAWNIRMGTAGLDPATLFQLAAERGMAADTIPVIVEEDSFVYNTTRYGKPARGASMVCCVFVCRMWKAGGLFDNLDNEVQCAEQTNLDDYHLNILQPHPERPADCVAADPSNPLCQLTGEFTLVLNHYANVTPYANMSQSCPSLPPKYYRPDNC